MPPLIVIVCIPSTIELVEGCTTRALVKMRSSGGGLTHGVTASFGRLGRLYCVDIVVGILTGSGGFRLVLQGIAAWWVVRERQTGPVLSDLIGLQVGGGVQAILPL
jgi:hypothetical protein